MNITLERDIIDYAKRKAAFPMSMSVERRYVSEVFANHADIEIQIKIGHKLLIDSPDISIMMTLAQAKSFYDQLRAVIGKG